MPCDVDDVYERRKNLARSREFLYICMGMAYDVLSKVLQCIAMMSMVSFTCCTFDFFSRWIVKSVVT